jgi:hypothetical protein
MLSDTTITYGHGLNFLQHTLDEYKRKSNERFWTCFGMKKKIDAAMWGLETIKWIEELLEQPAEKVFIFKKSGFEAKGSVLNVSGAVTNVSGAVPNAAVSANPAFNSKSSTRSVVPSSTGQAHEIDLQELSKSSNVR